MTDKQVDKGIKIVLALIAGYIGFRVFFPKVLNVGNKEKPKDEGATDEGSTSGGGGGAMSPTNSNPIQVNQGTQYVEVPVYVPTKAAPIVVANIPRIKKGYVPRSGSETVVSAPKPIVKFNTAGISTILASMPHTTTAPIVNPNLGEVIPTSGKGGLGFIGEGLSFTGESNW